MFKKAGPSTDISTNFAAFKGIVLCFSQARSQDWFFFWRGVQRQFQKLDLFERRPPLKPLQNPIVGPFCG